MPCLDPAEVASGMDLRVHLFSPSPSSPPPLSLQANFVPPWRKASFHLSALLLLFWINYFTAPGLTSGIWDQLPTRDQIPTLHWGVLWEVPLPPLWPYRQGRQLDPTGYLWRRCWRPAKRRRHLLCSFVAPHSWSFQQRWAAAAPPGLEKFPTSP